MSSEQKTTAEKIRTVNELGYPIKPRRSRGTEAYRARNRFASAVILAGSLIGVAWMYLPSTNKIRKDLHEKLLVKEVDPKDRMHHISVFGRTSSAEDIEKLMQELGRPLDKPLPPRDSKTAETKEQ